MKRWMTALLLLILAIGAWGQDGRNATASDEARRHFIAGNVLLAETKTRDGLVMAEKEYENAKELAPLWVDVRFKVVTVKEALGDFEGALKELKSCSELKLDEYETKKVKEEMEAIGAIEKMARDGDARRISEGNEGGDRLVSALIGNWISTTGLCGGSLKIERGEDGLLRIYADYGRIDPHDAARAIRLQGNLLLMIIDRLGPHGYVTDNEYFVLRLDEKNDLEGTMLLTLPPASVEQYARSGMDFTKRDARFLGCGYRKF